MTKHGCFQDQDIYRSFLLKDPMTPRRWQHYLYNENMLLQVDQFGQGMSRYWDKDGKDTILFNAPERSLILRNENGSCWSPAVAPFGIVPQEYQCTYNPAYWQVSGQKDNCKVKWKLFVPDTLPLEFWTVSASNTSNTEITKDMFLYMPVNLMGYAVSKYRFYTATTMFISGHTVPECNAIWIKNGIPDLPHDKYNVFIASETPYTSMDMDRTKFLGIAGNLNAASALKNGKCSNTEAYFGETCLAMHQQFILKPGETKSFRYLVGPASGSEEIRQLAQEYLNEEKFDEEEEKIRTKCFREINNSFIQTSNPALDSIANTWGKRQNRLGVLHRKGFRDVLQDSSGMLTYDQQRAKEGIKEVISVQNFNGSGIRAWKPYVDKELYSDGPYWLVLAVAEYLQGTGDFNFLNKELAYFNHSGKEPIWEHLIKAVNFLYNDRSDYGFCRIRFADWNDGLDGVGCRGKGDSVMVTCGLIKALRKMKGIAAFSGKNLPFDPDAWIADLETSLEKNAWTGDYYIRGYRDDGQPYGSPENKYGKIYLNAQGWAVLSEAAPEERREKLLKLTIDKLGTSKGLKLFSPCYPGFDPYLGRVSAELPGVYENGAMYNHGGAFFLHALVKAGMIDEAWKYAEIMLPDSKANPSDLSGAEPFVLTNCIFGKEAKYRAGTSYFGWYTGTAAWILRLMHNSFSGISPDFEGLKINTKQIPDKIILKSYRRNFRGTVYDVKYNKSGKHGILVDGVSHEMTKVLPEKSGSNINVVISY